MPVLLRGEPGVMPELFARYLHQPNTPWVVAGAALADAPQDLLAQAASGLLFVEELAALSRAQQKNLTFILGKQDKTKTRVVSFTAEDPARLAAELGFDAGLLARLSELSLPLPALREHAEDIPDIAGILLAQLVEAKNCPPRHFSTAALNALRQFRWPRNLQDLQAAVKNLALTALEEEIGVADVERVAAQFHPAADTQVIPLSCRCARRAKLSSARISNSCWRARRDRSRAWPRKAAWSAPTFTASSRRLESRPARRKNRPRLCAAAKKLKMRPIRDHSSGPAQRSRNRR